MRTLNNVGSIERKENGVRPNLRLDDQDTALLEEYITAHTLMDAIEDRHDQVKQSLLTRMADKFTEAMWRTKRRPQNPHVRTLTAEGYLNDSAIYQLQSTFNLSQYEGEEDPKGALLDALTEPETPNPLDRDKAALLIRREIIFSPALYIRGITDLTEGRFEKNAWVYASEEEKQAGAKLINYLQAKPDIDGNITIKALTRDELNIVLVHKHRIKVKDVSGFFKRIFHYVDTLGQLRRVFKIMKPTNFISNAQFALSSSQYDKRQRLIGYVNALLA